MTINGTPHKGTLKQRIFAIISARRPKKADPVLDARKRALLSHLQGTVLEIGPGSGPNLPYYPTGICWIGVEPNPYMYPYLRQAIQRLRLSAQNFYITPGDAQSGRLPADDASVDAVVGTLVLCSVPHPEVTMQEILRVLKPGGRYVFIEHVAAAPGSRLRALQNFVQPVWTWLAEGCHPNRETWETIALAGFQEVQIEHYRYPGLGPVEPQIAGQAIKGG